jgi:IS30 family transposase
MSFIFGDAFNILEVQTMATYKHLTLSEREIIERLLKEEYSFKAIARELNRDCTTMYSNEK